MTKYTEGCIIRTFKFFTKTNHKIVNNMKTIIFIFFQITFFNSALFGQESISLTVSAQGKTKEEAKYNAFRDALERAFGTFISTNTQVLNDELIKDEIVSVSSGNIEKFEIKSEVQLPDGTFTNVIDVTVSLNKLKSFCESKGIIVEFQGSLFAANIKLEKMNQENEKSVTSNMYKMIQKIVENGLFDYTIKVEEPKTTYYDPNVYDVNIVITASINQNLNNIASIIKTTISGLSLSSQECVKLEKQRVSCYTVKIDGVIYYLRNWMTVIYLRHFFERIIPYYALQFEIKNGINKYNFYNDVISGNSNGGRIFYHKDLTEVHYRLYPKMNSNGRIKERMKYYYDEISKVGLDWERQYYKDGDGYGHGYPETDEGVDEDGMRIYARSIYADINFSIKNINQITFKLTEALTLSEMEKITEYKVIPKQ